MYVPQIRGMLFWLFGFLNIVFMNTPYLCLLADGD